MVSPYVQRRSLNAALFGLEPGAQIVLLQRAWIEANRAMSAEAISAGELHAWERQAEQAAALLKQRDTKPLPAFSERADRLMAMKAAA